MPIVVKIHPHLLARMYSVSPQDRRAARGDPHACQRVSVHLVLLDQPLSLLMHINTPVLPVVNLVVPHDGITISPNLNARQCIPVNIVVLDQSAPLTEYINTALVPVVYFVPSDCRVTVRGNPHARKIIRMDLVVYELPQTIFVHVNSSRLPVVDLTMHYRRIGACLYFKTCYSIVVDIVCLEVTLKLVPINTHFHIEFALLTRPLSNVNIPTSLP